MATSVVGDFSAAPGRVKNALLWLLQAASAAVFVMAGIAKLTGAESMVHLFAAVGLGQWLRYFTGGLEVAGAVALLVPAIAGLGAIWLTAVMVGAVIAHLVVLGSSPAVPAALLVAMAIVVWGRWGRTARLFSR
jgi:putative oxidoreductase